MAQSGFIGWRTRDRVPPPPPARTDRARHRELKLKLGALQRDYADLHAALFEAGQVHRRLCAPRLVRCGAFDVASEIFAVRYLPGDFFTVLEGPSGAILALGDVCGKGLAAGMWTPCLVGLVRAQAAASPDLQSIVTGVNREFCRMQGPLTSVFIARLDPASGTLEYCSAGHPPALLLRADGSLELLAQGGMLLGMANDASFNKGCVVLEAGDVLLAYSDGVIESRNDMDQEFGCDRLQAQLRLAAGASADTVLFSVLAAVQDFAAPHSLIDDTSLVVVNQAATA